MKYLTSLLLLLTAVIACDTKNKKEEKQEEKIENAEPVIKRYGFVYNDFHVVNDTIKSGDTFGTLLQNYVLPDSMNVHQLTEKIRDSFNLRGMKAGKPYVLLFDKQKQNDLKAFIYVKDKIHYTVIDLRDSVAVLNKKRPLSIKKRTIAAEIEGSLSETLDREGVSASLAPKLASVYAYSIDFFKIQKGDKFAVTLYENFIEDSIYAGIDHIESTYFQHRGRDFYAFPYKLKPGQREYSYYDEEGKALKSMFLKAPLDYYRISSKFSGKRFHPVQKRWKAHNGTDYAAPHGTPIKATAAGVVSRAGYTSGNGNFVKIRHNATYSTQYLHMSKILVKKGEYVAQGQVIGKVGSTGLATGPHVCYRFWKNGVQVDPFKVQLPSAEPMAEKDRLKYIEYIKPFRKELDSILKVKFKE
ncbi:peptidoglycan DD-metalloendopeptidase family protein [Flavobacterium sp. NRK F10]|uniref:Peptidase M23 n=1 Tax=Flavobacterium sediminis TaxID=2201181 RepID=A0A2U8QTN8_9FLAO|nr:MULTISPECIES: peptidoglycan DD-metalloendopeptidase family protein [Flavobacterium]AWM13508.1 peptidase M23 [Flavobacterium sediminis]MCO6174621.1 peptidoglycan DD-metalloendopeptidase family protein [Flavobacterium sp. NRK F10]